MAQLIKSSVQIEGMGRLKQIHSIRISQTIFTHHSFEIVVPFEEFESPDTIFFSNAPNTCGRSISFTFAPLFEDFHNTTSDFVFNGIITDISLQNTSELVNIFVIKGYSPTFLLEDGVQRRAYIKQRLDQTFDAVLKPYPQNLLKTSIKPLCKDFLDYKAQYDESNFAFLNRLAAEYGEWFYFDGTTLVLGSPSVKSVKFVVDGIQKFGMNIGIKPSNFSLHSYTYRSHTDFEGQSSAQNIQGLVGFTGFAHQTSLNTFSQKSLLMAQQHINFSKDIDEQTKRTKSINASNLVTFSGTGEIPNLNVGSVIEVLGQKLDENYVRTYEPFGKFRIIEIEHTVNSIGNYENFFKAVPESILHPPANPTCYTPIARPELAKVIQNDDFQELGRVKVKFFWATDNQAKSDWIRIAFPYTGSSRGMLWVPEKDDQVMVGYEQNNPDFPFVIGSVYHKAKDGTKYTNESNNQKIIRTKGGNKIAFKDKGSEQEIYITNSNKKGTSLHISFKDNGVITLKTVGDIILEAGNDIKMKAGNNVSIEAQKEISINAGQTLNEKGGKSVNIRSGNELNVQGDNKTVIHGGGGGLNVQSTKEVHIKGPKVKVN